MPRPHTAHHLEGLWRFRRSADSGTLKPATGTRKDDQAFLARFAHDFLAFGVTPTAETFNTGFGLVLRVRAPTLCRNATLVRLTTDPRAAALGQGGLNTGTGCRRCYSDDTTHCQLDKAHARTVSQPCIPKGFILVVLKRVGKAVPVASLLEIVCSMWASQDYLSHCPRMSCHEGMVPSI